MHIHLQIDHKSPSLRFSDVDFLENLADGLDKKVKDVVKQLDIETDESVAAKMPPKYIID